MRRVKGKDTAPELVVRRLVWRLGARYRLHRADLPGKPDLVLPGRRLVIFVHGCFWHGHGCGRCRIPATRRRYWLAKIERNRRRDRRCARQLRRLGWRVLTVWECRLKDRDRLSGRIARFLES